MTPPLFSSGEQPGPPIVPGFPLDCVDRILEQTPDSLRLLKNVTVGEELASDGSALPMWVVLESLIQAAGRLDLALPQEKKIKYPIIARMKRVRFLQPVFPGDQLLVTVKLLKRLEGHAAFSASLEAGGLPRAEAELYFLRY